METGLIGPRELPVAAWVSIQTRCRDKRDRDQVGGGLVPGKASGGRGEQVSGHMKLWLGLQ